MPCECKGLASIFTPSMKIVISVLAFCGFLQLGMGSYAFANNTPPVIDTHPDHTVTAWGMMGFQLHAKDAESNKVTWSLVDVPDGTVLATNSLVTAGADSFTLLTWTPTPPVPPLTQLTNTFTLRVTDDGLPNLSSSNTFRIIYIPPTHPVSSYSFPLEKGWYLIACQLDNLVVPFEGVLAGVPENSFALTYKGAPPIFTDYTMDELDGIWTPTLLPLAFGNPMIYRLETSLALGSMANTITGTPRSNVISLAVDSQPRLYGGQTTGVSTYETIVGSPPEQGTVLYRLNLWASPFQTAGSYRGSFDSPRYLQYEFLDGRWLPAPPIINLGEAVWIFKRPILNAPAFVANAFWFSFPTAIGQTNFIQFANGSPTGVWQSLTNFVGNGNVVQIADPVGSPPGISRFYRAAVWVNYDRPGFP